MLQHQTKIELKAEPTHDGTNDIIAAIIDKLGELTHGCAIITGCTMTIDWITGGTYQTHLEHVGIHDAWTWLCAHPRGPGHIAYHNDRNQRAHKISAV